MQFACMIPIHNSQRQKNSNLVLCTGFRVMCTRAQGALHIPVCVGLPARAVVVSARGFKK